MTTKVGESYEGYVYSKMGYGYLSSIFSMKIPSIVNIQATFPIYKFKIKFEVIMREGNKSLIKATTVETPNITAMLFAIDSNSDVLRLVNAEDQEIGYFSISFESLIPMMESATYEILNVLRSQLGYFSAQLNYLKTNKDVLPLSKMSS